MNLIKVDTIFNRIIHYVFRKRERPINNNYVCLTTVLSRKRDEFGFDKVNTSDDTTDKVKGDGGK